MRWATAHWTQPDVDERAVVPAAADETERAVLVIGGAGFVGSHLVDRLIAEGHRRRRRRPLDRLAGQPGDGRGPKWRGSMSSSLHIHTLEASSDDLAT